MALRSIHLLSSPVLRQRSEEIDTIDDDVRTLVRDLFDTMYAAEGIGLAANQLGVALRVAVVEAGGDPPLILINPVILESEGKVRDEEGCLSIPDIFGDVNRAERIVVETTTLEGDRKRFELRDLAARADGWNGVPLCRFLLLRFARGDVGYPISQDYEA